MARGSKAGVLAAGTLAVLFVGTSGSTVWLGLERHRLIVANQRLEEQRQALQRDLEQKDRAILELSDRRTADEAEILRLQQDRVGHATTITRLREQVGILEQQATALHDEIARARTDSQVKEATLADLATRLEETRARADGAAQQLRAMGYTKDELTDQVGKLRTRLAESDQSLGEVRKRVDEQERALTRLNEDLFARTTALGALQRETETLRVNNGHLQRELANRPKPSPFTQTAIYVPSRDSRRAKTGS